MKSKKGMDWSLGEIMAIALIIIFIGITVWFAIRQFYPAAHTYTIKNIIPFGR